MPVKVAPNMAKAEGGLVLKFGLGFGVWGLGFGVWGLGVLNDLSQTQRRRAKSRGACDACKAEEVGWLGSRFGV